VPDPISEYVEWLDGDPFNHWDISAGDLDLFVISARGGEA
jgi:hypothetical protein